MRRIINNEQRDLYIGLSENVRNMAECASIPSESDDDEDIRDDKLSNFSIKKQTSYRYVYTPLYPPPPFLLVYTVLAQEQLNLLFKVTRMHVYIYTVKPVLVYTGHC